MNDQEFLEIKDSLTKGADIWLQINSGKYLGSIAKALDAKTSTKYYGDDERFRYIDYKIKFKINGRNLWQNIWYLHEASQKYETIVTRSVADQKKQISKDFLDREFDVGDVVFLHSPTYGEILGVINKISDTGTLTIRIAKKQNEWYTSKRSKQGVFLVPHSRADCSNRAGRLLIIDDPAVLLLRA